MKVNFCKHCDLKLSPQERSPLEIFSDLISDLNQWSRIEDLFTFYFQVKKIRKSCYLSMTSRATLSWNFNYACDDLHRQAPTMKLTLSGWGELLTKKFHPSSSTRRAQLSVAATTGWSTDLNQYWLDKIRKAFSS